MWTADSEAYTAFRFWEEKKSTFVECMYSICRYIMYICVWMWWDTWCEFHFVCQHQTTLIQIQTKKNSYLVLCMHSIVVAAATSFFVFLIHHSICCFFPFLSHTYIRNIRAASQHITKRLYKLDITNALCVDAI